MIVINQVAAERMVDLLEKMVAQNCGPSKGLFRWVHNSDDLRDDAAAILQYIREGQPDPCDRIHIQPRCSR